MTYLEQTVAQLKAQGVPDEMINAYVQSVNAATKQSTPSQLDRVEITQAVPDAEGFYITAEMQAQDRFNEALMRNRMTDADAADGLVGGPPTAATAEYNMAMGNPNYVVREEGNNVTVNANGDIIRF